MELVIGFKPKSIYTNKFSGIKRKNINVIGSGKNKKLNFLKPKTSTIATFMFLLKFLPKSKIKFNEEKCIKCGLCSKKCPVNAITLKPWPECNHSKCIRCLCCIEVCPHDAVLLEEHIITKTIKNIGKKLMKS